MAPIYVSQVQKFRCLPLPDLYSTLDIQHISVADCQIIYYQQKYQKVYQFKLILLPNHPVLYPAESQSGSQAAAEHV